MPTTEPLKVENQHSVAARVSVPKSKAINPQAVSTVIADSTKSEYSISGLNNTGLTLLRSIPEGTSLKRTRAQEQ